MLTKELFIEVINSMQIIDDYQRDKNKLYKKYNADGYLIEPDNKVVILKLLRLLLPDDFYYSAIEEFCLTNNYGRGKNNGVYTDINGQRITISSSEELYNYIFGDGDEISAITE